MESINEIKVLSGSIRRRARSLLVFSFSTAISLAMAANANAQTFAEWFSQKKTQKKYLLQQIAALEVYSRYVKQGYGIASNGLGSISGCLKTENKLHLTYYNRLKTVAPVVKNDAMVKDILVWQQDILKRLQELDKQPGINPTEQNYISNVSNAVLKDCDQQLSTLETVTGDGKIEMSDAERLSLITQIHSAMLDNYRFASGFSEQVKILLAGHRQDQRQTIITKRFYGIN